MAESIPIWHKTLLTLEEVAAYSGIVTGKLRELSNDENCSFVVWNGRKRLLKRTELDEFISVAYSI